MNSSKYFTFPVLGRLHPRMLNERADVLRVFRKPWENSEAARKLKINKWSYYKLKKRPTNVDFGQ